MSGRMRGTGWKSDLLDTLYGRKKLAILSALVFAVIVYLLFLLFGDTHATEDALYRPVVMGLFAFGASFLVLLPQLKNPFCTAKSMDNAELFFSLATGVGGTLWFALYGIGNLFGNDAYIVATMAAELAGVWCGLCVIHNMRK